MKTINISYDTLLKIKHNIKNKHGSLNTNEFKKIKINEKIFIFN